MKWTVEALSQKYRISAAAVSRILHSKWSPDPDALSRQAKNKWTFNQKVFVEKMMREATLLKKVVDMYAEDTNDVEGLNHVINVAKTVLSQARYLQSKILEPQQTEQQQQQTHREKSPQTQVDDEL